MIKNLLTIDDLYKFFVDQNKNVSFSVKETKTPIIVSVPGTFAKEEEDMPGLLKLKLKVCHTDLNRQNPQLRKYTRQLRLQSHRMSNFYFLLNQKRREK